MNQRTFLTALGVGICLVVAGCVTPLGENRSNALRCSLEHEIVDDRNRVDTVEQRYAYANLSSSTPSDY